MIFQQCSYEPYSTYIIFFIFPFALVAAPVFGLITLCSRRPVRTGRLFANFTILSFTNVFVGLGLLLCVVCVLFLCDFRLFFIDVNVPLSLHLFRFIPPLSLPFLIQTDQFKCPDSISSDKGRGWQPKKKRLLLHALSRVWTNYCQVHRGSSFACVHFPRRIRSEEWEEVVGPLLDQGQLRQQRHWTSFE